MLSFLKRLAAAAMLLAGTVALAQQTRNVSQGVYTDDQARRGQATYKEQCAICHGDTLGGALAPPLAGDEFLQSWEKEPLSDLFNKIRNTMPQGAPGKLTPQQTAEIVAYMLQAGKFPAGGNALPADEAALKQIAWPVRATAQVRPSTGTQSSSFPAAGNLSQVMRGILFPSSNIIFTVQTHDPGEKRPPADVNAATDGGFNFMVWGGSIYSGWELVDYAAIALAESAPLMLTPGRRCENGKPVPINDPEWIQFTNELYEAGKAAYKASQSRNQEAVSEVSNQVADSCMNCHVVYRDKRQAGRDPLDPSNKAARCEK
jgi:mono/diheme cytochrome c family protein